MTRNRYSAEFRVLIKGHCDFSRMLVSGIPQCSIHGLCKAMSRHLAQSGTKDAEGQVVVGHKRAETFVYYRAKANRTALADRAVSNLALQSVAQPAQNGDEQMFRRPSGARGRNRTADTMIFSHVLYQLSYPGIAAAAVLAGRRAIGSAPMAKRRELGKRESILLWKRVSNQCVSVHEAFFA